MTPWQQHIAAALPAADTPGKRTSAIVDALAMMPAAHGARGLISTPRLVLPYGDWELAPDSDGVCIKIPPGKHVDLDLGGSGLLIPDDATAIHIGYLSSRSCVRNGVITSTDGQRRGRGVALEAPLCTLERVMCRDLVTGFDICGRTGQHNANGTRALFCEAYNCNIGFNIRGDNANAGVFIGCSVTDSDEGLIDESGLGNLFDGWLFENIARHALWIGDRDAAWQGISAAWDDETTGAPPAYGSNASTYEHVHVEQGCGYALPGYAGGIHPLSIDARRAQSSTCIGRLAPQWQGGDRVGYGHSRLRFRETVGDNVVEALMPEAATLSALRVWASDYAGERTPFALRYRSQPGYPRDAGFFRARDGVDLLLRMPVGWTDDVSTDGDDARVCAPGPSNADLAGRRVPRP